MSKAKSNHHHTPKNAAQPAKKSAKEHAARKPLSPKATAAIAAVVVIVLFAVILRLALGSGSSVLSVLQQYYENMYVYANAEKMAECLPEGEVRDHFMTVYTLGGVSNMALTDREQAITWVGEEVSVTVSIVEQERSTATALNAARAENSAVESVSDATFDIYLTGNTGDRTLRGQTTMVMIDGQWYLPNYNIYIGYIEE